MKILILLLLFLKLSLAGAQAEVHTPNKDSAHSTIEFLLGFWIQDSSTSKIEFKIVQNELELVQKYFYTFSFLRTDSFPLAGVSITWPPHVCLVKKLDENYIEIQYTLFGRKPEEARFKRLTHCSMQSPGGGLTQFCGGPACARFVFRYETAPGRSVSDKLIKPLFKK